ncbi:hypothetical protein DEO72_LG5g1544 [Vigna unguiculata]|uniref:Uncharacterized protein n=1 Tax=Vigna unguiculata TaxID=3917 RepID=A0A4D6LWQ5_VIGUN|nr:hypothetical protein DEO72_LG5g1544 [Vigna unguiculata]
MASGDDSAEWQCDVAVRRGGGSAWHDSDGKGRCLTPVSYTHLPTMASGDDSAEWQCDVAVRRGGGSAWHDSDGKGRCLT